MKRTYDDRMFIDTFEHEYTWLNGFLRNVKRYPNRLAVIDPETDTFWTYRELDNKSNSLANALKKNGINKNDLVMGVLRNCPEFCTSYIAPKKLGAIFLAANTNLASREMSQLIDYNEPKIIIYSSSASTVILKALEQCHHKPDMLCQKSIGKKKKNSRNRCFSAIAHSDIR